MLDVAFGLNWLVVMMLAMNMYIYELGLDCFCRAFGKMGNSTKVFKMLFMWLVLEVRW